MSTHNMFLWRNKKNVNTFGFEKHLTMCGNSKGPKQSCILAGLFSVEPDNMDKVITFVFCSKISLESPC